MYFPNPTPYPRSLPELTNAVWQELQRISAALEVGVEHVTLTPLHAEPERRADGMVVLADGTDWNPGSGAGFYGYNSGAWTFLG